MVLPCKDGVALAASIAFNVSCRGSFQMITSLAALHMLIEAVWRAGTHIVDVPGKDGLVLAIQLAIEGVLSRD